MLAGLESMDSVNSGEANLQIASGLFKHLESLWKGHRDFPVFKYRCLKIQDVSSVVQGYILPYAQGH